MSSAAEFRDRFRTPTPILVPVPGTDLTIQCRRPDLVHMVMSGLMTWPALERVRALAADNARATAPAGDTVIDNRPIPTLIDRARAVGAMLDEWVCIAAVAPKVVMTEPEETGDDTVWVERLPFEGRQAVFNATFRVTPTAGADFRGDQSGGASPGQSGEAVRDETVRAAGDDGSDGRVGS